MKVSRLRLPLKQLEKGQGFFVPCLDFQLVERHVMIEALRFHIRDLRAERAVLHGFIGLWFYRPAPRTP
jgi:hypothetical protein